MRVTKEDLVASRTKKGGYTKIQIYLAQRITGCDKWASAIVTMDIPVSSWEDFVAAGSPLSSRKRTKKAKLLNPFPVEHDGLWKPKPEDIPKIKPKKTKKSKGRKQKKEKVSQTSNVDFYSSREWRELRYRVLRKYDAKCMLCGYDGQSKHIHVDHIKPRSKFPELSLEFSNMQILCRDCNLGKSNKFSDDFRSKEDNSTKSNNEEDLDKEHLNSIRDIYI